MKASRSPSLSRSAKTGDAKEPTPVRLKGLLEDPEKLGKVCKSYQSGRAVRSPGVPLKSATGRKRRRVESVR
jgi:hypothetical protein